MMGLRDAADWKTVQAKELASYVPPVSTTSDQDSIDWRDVKDVVTPVKDQGNCGSCWAFSATETVESAYVIAGNEQVIMSPQELVDCSKSPTTNLGCKGGMYYWAWDWLKDHKTMKESDYPYVSGDTGKAGETCEYKEE